jgi:hypothetical protein
MSLSYTVLKFVDRVRKQPADGSDPRLLQLLEKYAKEAWEGIVALHAPASPMTWEVSTSMTGATQETNRQAFTFPRPVEIVGFWPTLTVLASGGASTPSTDSIQVSIDTDNQNYLSSGEGISTVAGTTAGPFVTLTAMSVVVPRIVGYKLTNPKPNIGFKYRWARDVTGGAVFKDVVVRMAMYARYLG